MVASDIDGTLHISRHNPDPGLADDIVTDRWTTGFAVTGPRGWRAWQELSTRRALVPVTGRSWEQFIRMKWPGPRPDYLILSGGGVVMSRGSVDDDWIHTAQTAARDDGWSAEELLAVLAPQLPESRLAVPKGAIGLLCVMPSAKQAPDASHLLIQIAAEHGWLVSLQGRKMFLQSPRTSKGVALAWLSERHNLKVKASAGDSILDLGMLASTRTRIVPAMSEAHHHAQDLQITTIHGQARDVIEQIPHRLLGALNEM